MVIKEENKELSKENSFIKEEINKYEKILQIRDEQSMGN